MTVTELTSQSEQRTEAGDVNKQSKHLLFGSEGE